MLVRIFQQFLISAAVFTGPLCASRDLDGPLAIVCADTTEGVVEEGAEEEDEREELFARVAEPIAEIALDISTYSVTSTYTALPLVCGPYHERGPPTV